MSDLQEEVNHELDQALLSVFHSLEEEIPLMNLSSTSSRHASAIESAIEDGPVTIDPAFLLRDNQTNRFATRELLAPWFPRIDPDSQDAQRFSVKRSQRQALIYTALCVAVFVLVVNLVAWSLFQTKWKRENGFGVLFHGDCTNSHRINTTLHLIINLLSTLLLGASNLCMQLLAAPTRKEIDVAHRRKRWLDIGTPSLRNLRGISTQRVFVWCIVGLTSIPLHFFYNSVIIPTVPVNAYIWAMVTPGFVSGTGWNLSETLHYQSRWPGIPSDPGVAYHHTVGYFDFYDEALKHMQMIVSAPNPTFERLENARCFAQYRQLLGNHSDLLLVTTGNRVSNVTAETLQIPSEYVQSNDVLQQNSVVAYGEDAKATWEVGWNFCDTTNGVQCIQPNSKPDGTDTNVTDWSIGGFLIDHCLSRQNSLQSSCSVKYSVKVLTIVCVFNFLKVLCIIYTAILFSKEEDRSMSILGDAISSFLEHQDPTTTHMSSIISETSLKKDPEAWSRTLPSPWSTQRMRYFQAVGRTRWLLFFLCSFALLVSASVFLGNGIAALKYRLGDVTLTTIFSSGFGGVSIPALLGILQGDKESSLYKNIFFANSWQFEISFIYLILNSIFSTMLASVEWDRFAQDRKFLRVTSPMGLQRSSYFVSMPAKYGIPFIAVFGLLHWAISQSIFVLRIERFYSSGAMQSHLNACGFSCFAIVVAMALGGLTLIAAVAFGMQKFPNGIPLAATCSAAISAACHPPEGDVEPHLFPVKWGVVDFDKEGRGICAFTTATDVRCPDQGDIIL